MFEMSDTMREVNISTQYGKVYGQAAGAAGESLVLGVHGWSKRNGWHTWAPLLQPLGQAGFHAVASICQGGAIVQPGLLHKWMRTQV